MPDHTHLMAGIQDLDLGMVKKKLMDPVEGEGWSEAYCNAVCQEYRRFLALVRAYPNLQAVPSLQVDKMWHAHILDTRKYGPDCERVLGFFLHHHPYFGMSGPQDEADLQRSADQTLDVYRRHFGDPPPNIWDLGVSAAAVRTAGPVKCGRPVKRWAPKCGVPKCGVARSSLPKCGAPG